MRRRTVVRIIAAGAMLAGLSIAVRSSQAYERYRSVEGSGCVACHGAFTEGFSPVGTVFPFDSNHSMHRADGAMNTACDMCHSDGDDRNPYIGFSDDDGFGGGPGVGCLGCHGRDYGARGVLGAGLRAVHRRSGVSSCGASSCHQNDPDPLPESVPPPYYGSPHTRAWDSCNVAPFFGENFSLDTDNHRGLDNDGDGLYDEDDGDCSCPLDLNGDGEVGFAEIIAILSAWGPCDECPEDVDRNGSAAFGDILQILANWGPC